MYPADVFAADMQRESYIRGLTDRFDVVDMAARLPSSDYVVRETTSPTPNSTGNSPTTSGNEPNSSANPIDGDTTTNNSQDATMKGVTGSPGDGGKSR